MRAEHPSWRCCGAASQCWRCCRGISTSGCSSRSPACLKTPPAQSEKAFARYWKTPPRHTTPNHRLAGRRARLPPRRHVGQRIAAIRVIRATPATSARKDEQVDTSARLPDLPEEVQPVLTLLRERIQAVLGDQLVGLYLYGSLSSGAFDPASSDVDFVAVTEDALP